MSKDNATVLGELTELDWTDASQEAIRHHALVCIESVALEPRADAGAGATDLELVIRVQLSNVERRSTIAYDGQQRIAHLPVLRDDRGVNLGRRERPSDRDGLIGKRYLMFRERVTDVFVFDAPAAGNGYLELELPAASWGSAGSCKFKIPTTMINKKTPTKRGDR
jgi:hypothetical protein